MAAYSAWNSAPSRLSHSSSDGVNGRGAEEIAGFGLGEDVDAEADVVPPVFVEEFAMLLRERVKRLGAQRKYTSLRRLALNVVAKTTAPRAAQRDRPTFLPHVRDVRIVAQPRRGHRLRTRRPPRGDAADAVADRPT
jgi:hypothetical protein